MQCMVLSKQADSPMYCDYHGDQDIETWQLYMKASAEAQHESAANVMAG